MATPRAKTYAVGSGQPVYAGRFGPARAGFALTLDELLFAGAVAVSPVAQLGLTLDHLAYGGAAQVSPLATLGVTLGDAAWAGGALVPPPATVAFVGDSNSSFTYNNSPLYWALAVNGGVLAPIIGAGVSGNTIQDCLARIDNDWTNASPGIANPPEPLGWVFLGGLGTNNARTAAMSGSDQTAFTSLVNKCKAGGKKVVIFSVPPLGGSEAAANANVHTYNDFYATLHDGVDVFYVDWATTVRGDVDTYLPGGVHWGDAGALQAGLDGGAGLATIFAPYGYTSPVDSAVGSTTTQWHTNPQNAGTGGTNSTGGSGSLPNGYTLSDPLATGNVANTSIVASGDSNPSPYVRISPTAMAAGGRLRLTVAGGGRSVTASDPAVLDCVLEVRFNAVNTSKLTDVRTWFTNAGGGLMVSGGDPSADLMLRLGVITSLTKTTVLRAKWKRTSSNVCASGGSIYFEIRALSSFSSSIGSIDVRCHTIKG